MSAAATDLLALAAGPRERTVARGSGGPLSLAELLRRAAALARRLPEPSPGSEVAFSFERDRAGLVAGLLATWSRGHTAVLPADGRRENIVPLLDREDNAAFLHDTGVGKGIHVPPLLAGAGAAEGAPEPMAWSPPHREVLVATRQPGLGDPLLFRWTAPELLALVERLAQQLELPPGAHVESSYSPSAPPGLLLGLLAPLRRSASFGAEVPRDVPELARRAREHAAHALVVAPAHARALVRLEPGALAPVASVYCADGGLDEHHAALLGERHGVRVVNVPALPLDEEGPPYARRLLARLLAAAPVRDADVAALRDAEGRERVFVAVEAPEAAAPALRALSAEHVPADVPWELRCVKALPRDANGRLPGWRTALLFRHGRRGRALEPEVAWLGEEGDDTTRRFRAHLPADYAFFEGHYTSFPVLAGAVQLHQLVLPCVRRMEPEPGTLRRLSGLKFLARIAPGDDVEVEIRRGSEPREFHFEIRSGETRASAGKLSFAP